WSYRLVNRFDPTILSRNGRNRSAHQGRNTGPACSTAATLTPRRSLLGYRIDPSGPADALSEPADRPGEVDRAGAWQLRDSGEDRRRGHGNRLQGPAPAHETTGRP